MKRGAVYLIGFALSAAIVGAGYIAFSRHQESIAIADLVQKTRENLVFVEGGEFRMGNYQTQYRAQNGTVEEGWAAGDLTAPAVDVTLNSFYLSAFETSYADFNLFLSAQGYPPLEADAEYHNYLPDRGAAMSFAEASNYCAWLGQQVGSEMRLPTEAEWEYAARSRGQTPLWATDDGNFERGRNVAPVGRDLSEEQRDPPIGSFPPNPLGLYNLADGLYEWISDRTQDDPDGAAIFKGGSNFSDGYYERIPDRGIAERRTEQERDSLLAMLRGADKERLLRQTDPLSPNSPWVTARCLVVDDRSPAESGFGQMPDPVLLSPPYSGQE